MIRAKRIYEPAPKKEEQVDLQKIIADAFQSSISKAEKASTGVSMEIERENKIIEKILYRIDDKLKSMKIDKVGVTEDVYNQLSSSLQKFGNSILDIVDSNAQTYLTGKDKDECISIAEAMVNEAVGNFDSLFKQFEDKLSRDLEGKADKEHSHDEFGQLQVQMEDIEEELENRIDNKANKKHGHEIGDVTGLSETLKSFAKTDHKHDEYATIDQLNIVSMQRSRGVGGGGHVVQEAGVVKAQRSNLNFIGAAVTDDPDNNATVITITGGSGSGDVVGPASATDNALARYDGITGKLIQNSGATLADDLTLTLTGANANIVVNTDSTTTQGLKIATSKFGIESNYDITGGYAAYFHSDGTANASPTNGVVRIRQATAGASGTALIVDNLGTSKTIDVLQSGTSVFSVNPAGSLEIGHTSDTTLSRVSAGVLAIEGVNIVTESATQTLTNKTITGSLPIAGTSAGPASLSLAEDTDNGTNKITIQAPASLAGDYTLTLPADDGASGNYLKTDGSGALSWDTPAAGSGSYNPVLAQVFM